MTQRTVELTIKLLCTLAILLMMARETVIVVRERKRTNARERLRAFRQRMEMRYIATTRGETLRRALVRGNGR